MTSSGMQGILGSGDYGYIAKGRMSNNQKYRVMSAGLSQASSARSQARRQSYAEQHNQ